jgi:hypothetical protein
MSPVKYELGFYIPEDDILPSHRRENLKLLSDLGCCFDTRFRIAPRGAGALSRARGSD